MKADKNPYTDRYIWTDKVWESPEVSFGGSLRGISERDGAVAVNFFSNQPALNYGFYQRSGERISSGNCLLNYGTGGTDTVYHERI